MGWVGGRGKAGLIDRVRGDCASYRGAVYWSPGVATPTTPSECLIRTEWEEEEEEGVQHRQLRIQSNFSFFPFFFWFFYVCVCVSVCVNCGGNQWRIILERQMGLLVVINHWFIIWNWIILIQLSLISYFD